ncbi:MAG: PspA/IM30 family protein [Gammaproteobacteria bacterium]|nr:PspA/IM30 family protein [Gammaproteobacteria bacterium]MDH4313312.1 PspA/IM30 family protein [Gammaproteobacteria bacterium]MDH5214683.1 PspA/IM30 family protein [Gammaproteobacteria bacterium]
MALINRISRLFKADFHAVLDRIEEPEQLLRQAIREMDDELTAGEQRIRQCMHEQQSLLTRKAELSEKLAEIESELDLCFASQKDDLARGLVRRKLEGQRLLKRLSSRESTNEKFLSDQRGRLDENRAALESLKQKAEIFAARPPVDGDTGIDDTTWLARELSVGEDEIEVAFLREQNARRSS